MRRVRSLAEARKLRDAEAARAAQPAEPYKMRRFTEGAESRLSAYRRGEAAAPDPPAHKDAPPSPSRASPVRRMRTRAAAGPRQGRPGADAGAAPVVRRRGPGGKPAVPRAADAAPAPSHAHRDILSANIRAAARMRPDPRKRAPVDPTRPEVGPDHGRVPKYLLQRKKEQHAAHAEVTRQQGEPGCPPGMRLMPDAERRETLAALQESLRAVLAEQARVPMGSDAPKVLRKRELLQQKEEELEEAVRVFSRDRVYVDVEESL